MPSIMTLISRNMTFTVVVDEFAEESSRDLEPELSTQVVVSSRNVAKDLQDLSKDKLDSPLALAQDVPLA
uniref:Uncharacterized protein n=1 Tax=Cannabis sativa TaxID=3483 RepID=A0A803NJD6_CANSA